MLSIGDNTILRKDTVILCYRAQSNFIHIGTVDIGSNVFVGEASVIDIDTAMGDNTQLGHASSLQSGQRIPDGKRCHGSPAIETACDYSQIEGKDFGAFRSALYTSFELAALVLIAVPVPILAYYFWEQYSAASNISFGLGASTLYLLGLSTAEGLLRRDDRCSNRDLCHPTLVHVVLDPWRHLSNVWLPLPDAQHHPAR